MTTGNCQCARSSSLRLLSEYTTFLREDQKLSDATIWIRRTYVARFLAALGKVGCRSRLCRLAPKTVHSYLIKEAKSCSRARCKHLSSSLRSFLRFAHMRGYLRKSLLEAVPVVRIWKLDRLPRGIAWSAVRKLLSAPDRRTHAGCRDYAILQLLAAYGVRIGQVTTLRLKDIRWHEGIICFQASKHGMALQMPLEASVADALLSYVRRFRKAQPFQEVFLTVVGRQRPLAINNHLGPSLDRYYRLAGIKSPSKGSHPIRHAFATKLMEQGVPIKTIADLLGHRSIDSTFIYTKVNLMQLRRLTREWPVQ